MLVEFQRLPSTSHSRHGRLAGLKDLSSELNSPFIMKQRKRTNSHTTASSDEESINMDQSMYSISDNEDREDSENRDTNQIEENTGGLKKRFLNDVNNGFN